MASKQKIAFFRKGKWPLANVSTAQALQRWFPEYDLQEFDLIPLLRRNPALVLINGLWIAREYSPDLIMRRRGPKDAFLITSYLFRYIKKLTAQLVRNDDFVFSFQIQSLFDTSVPGLPHFVYTDHTLLANKQYPGFQASLMYNPAWMALEGQIYQNAEVVFTRSLHVLRSVIEDYQCDPTRVKCVYAGSNVPVDATPPDPARYAHQNILFVGIDWERKGGPQLLEAFRLVRQQHPKATLTIVGPRITINEPGVEVVGRLPADQLPPYFRKASVFCMPTHLEPFGIASIEAMSYHLPVVSTNIGAMPDFILPGENGYLVEPTTVHQLAFALSDLIGDPAKCQRFGERSGEIAQRYTWDSVGKRMRQYILLGIQYPRDKPYDFKQELSAIQQGLSTVQSGKERQDGA